MSDCVEIVYELSFLINSTASETFVHTSGAVRSVDWILGWGAGLAVIGWIRDIGQNVLQSCFRHEAVAVPIYFHIFFIICRIPRIGLY